MVKGLISKDDDDEFRFRENEAGDDACYPLVDKRREDFLDLVYVLFR